MNLSLARISGFAVLVTLLGTSGCAVTPDPISDEYISTRSSADLKLIRAAEFLPEKPITLAEATARAVAANLDLRVKQIQSEVSEAELDQANYKMLPSLNVGWERQGTNVKITQSDDQIARTVNAKLAWNILDLGVSYARAKQAANQVLIAREQERKAFQDIVRQVRTAYFRAANAQRLLDRVQSVAKDIRVALRASHAVEQSHYQDAITAASYRREIVDAVRQTLFIRNELNEAKTEIADLLKIPVGVKFELASSNYPAHVPQLPMSLEQMESRALAMRPEIRIEDYNERASNWQAKEALYSMLPGLDLNVAKNYSSQTSYLAPNWISSGVRLGMNLFGLFAGDSAMEAAEKRGELARRRRLAMSLAVLTQVHMSYVKFLGSQQRLRLAREIADADQHLNRVLHADTRFISQDYFEGVRIAARGLESAMEEHRAYVDLVSAQGELIHAIGLDATPDKFDFRNIPVVTEEIRRLTAKWDDGVKTVDNQKKSPLDHLVDGLISDFASANRTTKLTTKPSEDKPAGLDLKNTRERDPARVARDLRKVAPAAGASAPQKSKTQMERLVPRWQLLTKEYRPSFILE